MITTRRSETNSINAFGNDYSKGGVALLERKEPTTYKDYVAPETTNESAEQAKTRMQENLAKLLNYDRYSEQVQDVAPVAVTVDAVETVETQASTAETIMQESVVSEDDIRPTSTTMQFGDGEMENFRMELKREEEEIGSKYKLNAKGKLVIVLYALVLTVVMTLIAINTGVLARLSATEASYSQQLVEKTQALSTIKGEIENVSSTEYITNQAEEFGMIK